MNIKEIIKKSESLKANRTNWVNNWQHLAEIFDPKNATFKQERVKGDKKRLLIYMKVNLCFQLIH